MKNLLIYPIKFYQYFISPLIGSSCRYSPTCSEYCIDSINVHGIFKGGLLSIKRILRCNPFGGHGYDPVPKKNIITKNNKTKAA